MNILMTSEFFYPHIGGLESITESLADEFTRMGHNVKIVTSTTEIGDKIFPYDVIRNPSLKNMWDSYRWCDVFVHQQLSLKRIWPLFFKRKPWFVVYHQVGWSTGYKGLIKSFISRFPHNICVSETTAKGYQLKQCDVIYNAYNDDVYKQSNFQVRKNIAFVGRLTKAKGVYLLIDAFNEFKEKTRVDYVLNIIGDSHERSQISAYASQTKYAVDIYFCGMKQSNEIKEILNHHHILAVTSTHPYYEAFGIVVLEGLACGCAVVGADGDGIEEALHSNGILYRNGDCESLCNALIEAYNIPFCETLKKNKQAKEWLRTRTKQKVAEEYIKIFKANK